MPRRSRDTRPISMQAPIGRAHPLDAERRQRWVEATRQLKEAEEELRRMLAQSHDEFGSLSRIAGELLEAYRQLRQALDAR